MNARSLFRCLFPVAALALCGSISLAQQPPPTPPSSDSSAQPPPAPVERQTQPHPGMRGPRTPAPAMHSAPPPMMAERGMRHMRGGPMEGGFGIAPEGMWWRNSALVQRLSLTPDQVKRMDSIVQQSRLQLIDLRANVERQELLLEPMLSANPPEAAKAMTQIDKVAQARAELEKANAKMLLGVRGVLTPEQWTKLNERPAREERGRSRFNQFRGPGRAEGQGGRGMPAGSGDPRPGPGGH